MRASSSGRRFRVRDRSGSCPWDTLTHTPPCMLANAHRVASEAKNYIAGLDPVIPEHFNLCGARFSRGAWVGFCGSMTVILPLFQADNPANQKPALSKNQVLFPNHACRAKRLAFESGVYPLLCVGQVSRLCSSPVSARLGAAASICDQQAVRCVRVYVCA